MKMVGFAIFASLALAAQGSSVDLMEGLSGKQMSLPAFASFFQQRFGQSSEDEKSHHNTWRKQASMYMGLLQALGNAVPKDKEEQTKKWVNEIIKLLKSPADQIFGEATNTSQDLGERISAAFKKLQTAEKKAEEKLAAAYTSNVKLATCFSEMHQIEDDKASHCGKHTPSSCYRMNATRKHKFKVSSQFPWECKFNKYGDPEKCAGDNSKLYQDLVSHKEAMQLAMDQWKIEKTACDMQLAEQYNTCGNTTTKLLSKRGECKTDIIATEETMCQWREWIQKRTDAAADLDAAQGKGPKLLPTLKKEWEDLQIIICMLETFRDRAGQTGPYGESTGGMTFKEKDYENCEKKVRGKSWVASVYTMESEEESLYASSKFNDATLKTFFTAGLAEYYRAEYFIEHKFISYVPPADRPDFASMQVTLFTTPKAQAMSTLFSEIPEKELPKSCAGYKAIDGEKDCSEDTKCRFYDTDSYGKSHSVSAVCPLESVTEGKVAMKVCEAGLRMHALETSIY